MILKASQRSGAKQLGLHLLKTEENEHVEIHEVSGFISDTVMGAMNEAYAAARGLAVPRLALLAPPASPHAYTRLFAAVFGLSEDTRARLQQRVEAREGILMRQFEPAAVGPRVAQPTLIVHDREDRINRFADAEAFRDAIPGAQLMETRGLGHTRLLRDEAVVRAVVAHLRD